MSGQPIRVLELRSVRGTGGGPEKTILLGAARSDPSRYAVTVCYIRDRRDEVFGIDGRAGKLLIDYMEIEERHSFDPGIWRPLRSMVRDHRIDIVHAHDYKTDVVAWLLARFEPVVPIATAHGWTGHDRRERLVYYPADRRLLARYPRVIAVSSEIRDTLIRSGTPAKRVSVVLNGIDCEAFRRQPARQADARRHFGFGPDDLVLGAVGRLEPQKRFDLLISAFAALARELPNARLVIGGDGSLRRSLDRLIVQHGLADRCRLLGHLDDVGLLHHALDLFVQSSDYEGTPNTVLEAMAFETPIVATDVGGTAELCRHRREALIVPPGDPQALARAIRDGLADRTAARHRALAARCRVEGELSFASRTRRIETIYDQILERSRAGAADRTAASLSRA